MNQKNLNAFLSLGYGLDYSEKKYKISLSSINSSDYVKESEDSLIKIGSNYLMNSISKNFVCNKKHLVPISGGLDSRAILAGLLEHTSAENIYTYTFGTPNTLDYDNYPYTLYVKLNRKWEQKDYPALVWIEFWDQFIPATERYEVFSREELNYIWKDWVISILENKARALIDLNRALLNKEISITNKQLENRKNEYLIEELVNKYIAWDTLYIEDWTNDKIEKTIINALESISKWESVYPYLDELKKQWASDELLKRVEYIAQKMIYWEWTVDVTDEVLMFTWVAWIVKWWIKYIIKKSTWKILFKLSYWEAAREIWKISYKITLFDISKYAWLKMKDIKNINPELYKRIINWKIFLKTNNWIEFKLKDRNAINQHIKWSINYRDDKSYFLTKDFDEVIDLHIEAMGIVSKNQWNNFNWKWIVAIVDMWRIIWIDVKNWNVQTKFMRIIRTIEWKIHLFPIK